jgi:hypothetical protein
VTNARKLRGYGAFHAAFAFFFFLVKFMLEAKAMRKEDSKVTESSLL